MSGMHSERHAAHRIGLLRAMVLGANDGIISTACLILGVAASDAERSVILTAGMAGLVAGAVSMALGEYVSVSSQRDSENADIAKEKWELETMPEHELDELTEIYAAKGFRKFLLVKWPKPSPSMMLSALTWQKNWESRSTPRPSRSRLPSGLRSRLPVALPSP